MEILSLNQLDLDQIYSVSDYLTWKFDDRVELLNGRIFPIPQSSGTMHQQCTGEIFLQLANYIRQTPYTVIIGPFNILLPLAKDTVDASEIFTLVQPDITVLCDKSRIFDNGCVGAPDLIVEVWTKECDKVLRNEKLLLYHEVGLREYWTVDIYNRSVTIYQFDTQSKFSDPRILTGMETISSSILQDFGIPVSDIFSA